jgi:hypothetical protein
MKTAIYIEDGVVQLVLTPESKFEKDAVKKFSGENLSVQTFNGSFYDCRGGWIRQTAIPSYSSIFDPVVSSSGDQSIMVRVEEKEEPKEIPVAISLSGLPFMIDNVSDKEFCNCGVCWPETISIKRMPQPEGIAVYTLDQYRADHR